MTQYLPPLPPMQNMGTLPQIPGYTTPGLPPLNPNQGMHQFYQGPGGEPISVDNFQDAVYVPQPGNPLYYGQTAAYTGPQGPTDQMQGGQVLPPVEEVANNGMTVADALAMMYSNEGRGPMQGFNPYERAFGQSISPERQAAIAANAGFSWDDPYDRSNKAQQDYFNAARAQYQADETR